MTSSLYATVASKRASSSRYHRQLEACARLAHPLCKNLKLRSFFRVARLGRSVVEGFGQVLRPDRQAIHPAPASRARPA